ncbi:asparagine synthase (glutamine-hydrolyzing) [Dechloromonas sp. ARDL1]|uniref:asparagine synthase (glutamine-hydrolyzing) n=1 Tax=Dechloromonas sp. ARDL1 TaxID=3322121 RepID=UPI003DA76A46
MCGLTGFLAACPMRHDVILSNITNMANAIVHRGPDDAGYWVDTSAGLGLAHRRLAILDLSAAGHQPMRCPLDRYVLVFNGEIYNHLELRAELERLGWAPRWRGHSDTETLLAGFSAWGISETIVRCTGMFALAVWDRELRQLTLARDRLGEKPLYYGWQGRGQQACMLFGSELKALRAHPKFERQINRGALALLMRHNYVPTPYSIYQGIYKLPPGCLLTVSLHEPQSHPVAYWSLADTAATGQKNPFSGTVDEAVDALEHLLRDAIGQQMLADVPLGAFLSGGIDSSTVVALMQAQSAQPIKTFTIGFSEIDYNEAEHASAVAKYLGTDHTTLYVSPKQAMDVIPRLPSLYCEPFSDSSQIPTFLVSQLARQHVTVSLSGDGGDELFGGYNRYVFTDRLWRNLSRFPRSLRRVLADGIRSVSPRAWNNFAGLFLSALPGKWQLTNLGEKLHKGAGVLAAENVDDLYRGLVSHWNPSSVMPEGRELPNFFWNAPKLADLKPVSRMMALDALSYLPDDILTKVDRAAMGVSLETRVPMLDHRIVEFAWRLPLDYKIRDGHGKWLLRQVLYRHVPTELIDRPKMGFAVPIDAWLRGPLRDWAEALMDPRRLRSEGYFDAAIIESRWREHLSGRRNWQYHLWDILMFQAWLEQHAQ